jgi:hypothetical protein
LKTPAKCNYVCNKDPEAASFNLIGYTFAKRPTRKEKLQLGPTKVQKIPQN